MPCLLRVNGIGRLLDTSNDENFNQAQKSLVLYFNRKPTDDEMRAISELVKRTFDP